MVLYERLLESIEHDVAVSNLSLRFHNQVMVSPTVAVFIWDGFALHTVNMDGDNWAERAVGYSDSGQSTKKRRVPICVQV